MLFLVDGYNVTMRDPATAGLSKERQREALVGRLARESAAMLGRGTVVVVFDARGQLGSSTESVAGVRVVYAPDADSEIVRRAEASGGEVTVVSSDKRLSARISQDVRRRVVYRDASACFEGARKARWRGRESAEPCVGEAAPPRADEITRELEGLWLTGEDHDHDRDHDRDDDHDRESTE